MHRGRGGVRESIAVGKRYRLIFLSYSSQLNSGGIEYSGVMFINIKPTQGLASLSRTTFVMVSEKPNNCRRTHANAKNRGGHAHILAVWVSFLYVS